MKLSRILVPLKGDRADEETVRLACNLGKQYKAAVYVLHVIEVKQALPLDADLPDEFQHGEEVLEMAEKAAQGLGVSVEAELIQARSVGSAIVDVSIERHVDLIIIPVTYRRRFGDFYLGQTAPYVLKHAPCRVWVLREPMSEQ